MRLIYLHLAVLAISAVLAIPLQTYLSTGPARHKLQWSANERSNVILCTGCEPVSIKGGSFYPDIKERAPYPDPTEPAPPPNPKPPDPSPWISVSSAYATLLGLGLCCLLQPYGSALVTPSAFFWRLSPITGLIDAILIVCYLCEALLRGHSFRGTTLALLLAGGDMPVDLDGYLQRHSETKRMLHMLDCFPAAVLIMRVAATRGSWITLLVGYMYAVSFTAVQVLVLSELFLWDRCNDGVTEGVRNLGLRLSRRRFGDLSLSRKFLVRDDGWAKNGLRLYCAIVSGPVVMLLLLCVCFVIWQKADLDYFHMMFGTDMRVLVDPLVLVLGTAGLGLVVDLVAYFFSATGVVALWTFVHGSVVFVRAYEEVGTYRPGWMDWLG